MTNIWELMVLLLSFCCGTAVGGLLRRYVEKRRKPAKPEG
jgi:uncharacterized membrane protein YoaK (UPF0700 family)